MATVGELSKERLLQEWQALKKVLARLEDRTGADGPGPCALAERLRRIESLLAGESAPSLQSTDWVELCHICGRRCWL